MDSPERGAVYRSADLHVHAAPEESFCLGAAACRRFERERMLDDVHSWCSELAAPGARGPLRRNGLPARAQAPAGSAANP